MKKTVTVLCAAILALTACGGGEDDTTGQDDTGSSGSNADAATAKDNIKAALLAEDTGLAPAADITEEQAGCVSDGMVDEVGVEKLQGYGLLNEDLEIEEQPDATAMDRGDAEAMAEVFVGCVDVEKLFEDQFAENGPQLSRKQRDCINEAVDADAIEAVLADTFQGEDAAPGRELQSQLMGCIGGGLGSSGEDEMQLPEER